ncbi:IclR family transcriptional regulator [Ramlibacter cellulosilyticus]|uniref:IclR family transcriptional regulator n=1 Tax=Ramlibacter cellulosilyticus TaxID=2764187 RepID=UPI00338E32B4
MDRALDILVAFTAEDTQLSAGELSRRTGLSRPTLYRLLHTLGQKGFVLAEGEPQRFRLGPAVGHLAHVWSSGIDLTTVAQEGMKRIQDETGETVALFSRVGGERVCVAELPSRHPLSFKRGVGYRERIALGASGRVILAYVDDETVQAAVRAGPLPFARKRFDEDLAKIRERGWGVSRDELIEGAVAIAAPFFRAGGVVAGSMAVFGPAVRIDETRAAEFGRLLAREAQQLSATLGWKPAAD